MAHVQLRHDEHGGFKLLIDNVDLSRAVLRDGFSIRLADEPGDSTALVTMAIAADTLDVDLPAAVVEAVREGGA